jgi:hypothetical protein
MKRKTKRILFKAMPVDDYDGSDWLFALGIEYKDRLTRFCFELI